MEYYVAAIYDIAMALKYVFIACDLGCSRTSFGDLLSYFNLFLYGYWQWLRFSLESFEYSA